MRCPCPASFPHYAQNVLELDVYNLFLHVLKSKPNALEEKKMKEKRTAKRGEMQVID